MSANFVARELGYHMTEGWGQGDQATQSHFRPVATFAERFGAVLAEVKELGFSAIDLWGAHLHYSWATPEHVALAKLLLANHGLWVASYAGWVPGGERELRAACRLCSELGIPVFGGFIELVNKDRKVAVQVLREFGVAYGYENHADRTPAEVLAKLGDGDGDVIGVALDTGWCGSNGMDAVRAVEKLAGRLKIVHLKDVKPPRPAKTGFPLIDAGHETCRLGTGVVPVEAIVKLFPAVGYRGPISIEHEPEDFDPREDCRAGLADVRRWLASDRATVPGGTVQSGTIGDT